ncbi:DUF3460 family protein [Burkholderiaceae bacterium DAT-1]|nr:DUF3460 family protein [Burkholderiaceae bacterium DAT-1]
MALLFKDIKYVSDHTRFMNEFLAKNPDVAQGQVEGRAILWDKEVDREFNKAADAVRVNQKPYAYQPD